MGEIAGYRHTWGSEQGRLSLSRGTLDVCSVPICSQALQESVVCRLREASMPTPRVGLPQDASSLEASTRHIPDPSVRKAIVAGHVEKHVSGNVPYASVHCISWRGMRYLDGSRRQRLGVQVRRSGRSPEHFRQHQVAALIGDAGLCVSSGRHVQGVLCCLMLLGGTCASL